MLVLKLPHVWSRFSRFVVALLCLSGTLQNFSFFVKVSKEVVMSCHFAWQAGAALQTCFCESTTCKWCGNVILRGRGSIWCVCVECILHATSRIWDTLAFTLYTWHFTLPTLHSTLSNLTLHTEHLTLCTLHSHSTLLHFAQYT